MQSYEKTVRVLHNDRYAVAATAFGEVRAEVIEATDDAITTYLTPADARRLARALKRAANVAEGKPAKAPKSPKTPKAPEAAAPSVLADSIGIKFHRNADGTYSTPDCVKGDCGFPDKHFDRTAESILADGGRVIS